MLHFGKKSMISVVRYKMKCHYAEVPFCVFVAVTEKKLCVYRKRHHYIILHLEIKEGNKGYNNEKISFNQEVFHNVDALQICGKSKVYKHATLLKIP